MHHASHNHCEQAKRNKDARITSTSLIPELRHMFRIDSHTFKSRRVQYQTNIDPWDALLKSEYGTGCIKFYR
jgi:hypothetical protein